MLVIWLGGIVWRFRRSLNHFRTLMASRRGDIVARPLSFSPRPLSNISDEFHPSAIHRLFWTQDFRTVRSLPQGTLSVEGAFIILHRDYMLHFSDTGLYRESFMFGFLLFPLPRKIFIYIQPGELRLWYFNCVLCY